MMVSQEQSGFYGFLLGTQGTSCFKPRGSPGSSPLRSDGSHDDQAGEAGPVEHSSAEAKSLKLKAKGLSGCHPSGQQPRQPDRRARGPNKGLLSQQFTKRTQSLKQLWLEAQLGKRQPANKIMTWEKKTLTLCSNLEVAEGIDVGVDEVGDEWEPE
jgi:hypothetical protein